MNPSTTLVIGATGTVGSHLVSVLADAGMSVKASTRDPKTYEGPGEGTRLDLTDPATFGAALESVQRMFLLAPPGHANQFQLLEPFLRAAFATGSLDRVVTMTAQGVDFSDAIPFRQLELFIEKQAAAANAHFVHLRPSWFAQNFHTFWGHGLRTNDEIALPAEDAKVAFIDARDVAAAAAGALRRTDGLDRAYVLTGPEALTHAEAAAVLSRTTGRTIRYRSISPDAFRAQLAPSGLPIDYIELLVGLFEAVRMGAAAEVNDNVKALAGKAARPLDVYAEDYVSALR